jgi:hypothetical protein
VCADVVDLGMVENAPSGKLQHKLALVFHTEEKMRDGRPFEVWERFTASLEREGHAAEVPAGLARARVHRRGARGFDRREADRRGRS